jgi:hypothetical protein
LTIRRQRQPTIKACTNQSLGGSALFQLDGSHLQLGSHRTKLLREGRPMRARNLAQPARSLSEKLCFLA